MSSAGYPTPGGDWVANALAAHRDFEEFRDLEGPSTWELIAPKPLPNWATRSGKTWRLVQMRDDEVIYEERFLDGAAARRALVLMSEGGR